MPYFDGFCHFERTAGQSRTLGTTLSLDDVANVGGHGRDKIPARGHVPQMIFLPIGAGDQIVAAFQSPIQNDSHLTGFGVVAGRQSFQTNRAQIPGWSVKRTQNLLGDHRPDFPRRRKEAGEFGLIQCVVAAQQDNHGVGRFRGTHLGLRG